MSTRGDGAAALILLTVRANLSAGSVHLILSAKEGPASGTWRYSLSDTKENRIQSPAKHEKAAALVRRQVTSGTLPPGAPAPSGAHLARITGYSVVTCRRALRTLVTEGTLTPGASRNARPRVPGHHPGGQAQAASRTLSTALARHRRAAGLTQPQLATLIGLSVTTIGHAETGRTWQGRPFWEQADSTLHAGGELLRLHDAYRTAQATSLAAATGELPPGEPGTAHATGPARPPAAVTIDVAVSVNRITITWADGTVTTVRPPAPAARAWSGTDDVANPSLRHHP